MLTFNERQKSLRSKISFALGRNPQIEQSPNYLDYVPLPYKAVLTITADFELAWAWCYATKFEDSFPESIRLSTQARKNIPRILQLCEQFNIPITWATVGHLFLKECNKTDSKAHANLPRLPHFKNEWWQFNDGDWFQYDPCCHWQDAPAWYAPDLINMILNSKIKHEIGCHTFSHIACSDDICPPEVLKREICECKKAAAEFDIQLKSFVHPGHTIGNLDMLKAEGFTSFQSDNRNTLGYPVKHKTGLWEFKRTMEFVYRKEWSAGYHINRYKKIVDRSIRSQTVCNFWFHPSMNSCFIEEVLPSLFSYISSCRETVWITTINKYISFLEED